MTRISTALILICLVTFSSFGGGGDSALILRPDVAKYDYDAIPKDPLASAFFSATIPGTGQIYNKEYIRGILTAAGFYIGLFTAQYMLDRWDAQNTDTLYFEEYDRTGHRTGTYREYYAPKADEDVKGLPTSEKVVLGVSALMAGGFWVWGVVDAYQGAKRYNAKLNNLASSSQPLKVNLAYNPDNNGLNLNARLRF